MPSPFSRAQHHLPQPENILCGPGEDDFRVVIADFGYAKTFGRTQLLTTTGCGTTNYMAPEVLRLGVPYDEKCDMWSLGVLFFVTITGHFPFYGPDAQMRDAACRGAYDQTILNECDVSPQARDLISKLLQPDPALRLDSAQALSHPWITQTSVSYVDLSRSSQALQQYIDQTCQFSIDTSDEWDGPTPDIPTFTL